MPTSGSSPPSLGNSDVAPGTLVPVGSSIFVDGGNPSASDVLNFTGSGGAVTLNPTTSTIQEAGFGPVSYTGIETINVNANIVI